MGNLSKVKNENYVQIQGWMVNELKLKGNELLVYAIIYGFSQAENQSFTGSSSYIAGWLNVTKKTALDILKSLVSKGMITKKEVFRNDVKFCEYRAVTNLHQGGVKITPGVEKNLHQGGVKITPNNTIYNNRLDNIDYNTKKDAFTHVNDRMDALKPKASKESPVKCNSKTDYTEEKLKAHIIYTVDSIMKNEYLVESDDELCVDLKKIILYFYQRYNEIFLEKHPILSDISYGNIADRYMNPYGKKMSEDNVKDFDTYKMMIDLYFQTDFGRYKGTPENFNYRISHFMSDNVRENLYMKII